MAPGKSATTYTSWTTAYPQQYIPKQTAANPQEYISEQTAAYPQESTSKAITCNDILSDLLSEIPDTMNDPDEELIQEFMLESWV